MSVLTALLELLTALLEYLDLTSLVSGNYGRVRSTYIYYRLKIQIIALYHVAIVLIAVQSHPPGNVSIHNFIADGKKEYK